MQSFHHLVWALGHSEIAVPATPAGAIHGRILDHTGAPFSAYFYVSPQTLKESPHLNHTNRIALQGYNAHDASGRFLISPVPLDGTYFLIASAGGRYAVSDPIDLRGDNPIREITLRFAQGITLSGRVLDPDGRPLSKISVDLSFSARRGGGSGSGVETDAQGRFSIDHVDTAAPGTYTLSIRPRGNTQGFELKPLTLSQDPIEIRLERGLSARGRVFDVDTKNPLPNLEVYLDPVDLTEARYKSQIQTRTDAKGEFELHCLEPLHYRVRVSNTYHPDAKILRDAAGKPTGVQSSHSPDKDPILGGGTSQVLDIPRLKSPWHSP